MGVKTLFIQPGCPWESGYNESFNGKLRDQLLNGEIYCTLREAAGLLSRALTTRTDVADRRRGRAELQQSLGDDDPSVRLRALEALMVDQSPLPADLDLLRTACSDSDPAVLGAADRAVRVVAQVLERRQH